MIKYIFLLAISSFMLSPSNLHAQSISFDKEKVEPVNVSMTIEKTGR